MQEPGSGSTDGAAEQEEKQSFDGNLHFENGMAQPMLNHSSYDTPNEESEIQRLCVYVETDHDTDGDGKADLAKACLQIPRSAVEGQYKAAVIYDLFLIRQEPIKKPKDICLIPARKTNSTTASSMRKSPKERLPGRSRQKKQQLKQISRNWIILWPDHRT